MAIGSEAEIGAVFGTYFKKDEYGWITAESMRGFYEEWRGVVGDDLQGGWATLQYAPGFPPPSYS